MRSSALRHKTGDRHTASRDSCPFLTDDERAEVRDRLREEYRGVLDASQLERHIDDYLGRETAEQQVDLVLGAMTPVGDVLDVGCGYGSFVLAARLRGLSAVGVDVSTYELAFARGRLGRCRPGDEPDLVYRTGTGHALPYADRSFDAVTLWNVLEHVDRYELLLAECARVLRRDGAIHVVCPNYAAWREEAHYHVLLPPLLPKSVAAGYLQLRGKDPRFFLEQVFCRTNWGVLRALGRLGLEVHDPRRRKLIAGASTVPWISRVFKLLGALHLTPIPELALMLTFYNPFRASVRLYARPRSDSVA